MHSEFFALASFVVITTFTPGPNNISSAAMGIIAGYRKTLPYLAGIAAGFFIVMLLCGWISAGLREAYPAFENVLRILGSGYILWLGWHTVKASYVFRESDQRVFGFSKGFLLQLLNPKVIVYGLTVYASFLGALAARPTLLVFSAAALAGIGFMAISTWTLFGASIRKYMNRPRLKQGINICLALMLMYTAFELSGLLDRIIH